MIASLYLLPAGKSGIITCVALQVIYTFRVLPQGEMAESTKVYRPWERVLLEEHSDRNTAKRERYLKSGWGRRWLKEQI